MSEEAFAIKNNMLHVASTRRHGKMTVMYKIMITETAAKWLKKSDKEIQRRFAFKIRKLGENPETHGKPLRAQLNGYWELYFERKFRIIFTIDYQRKIVTIEAIKHKTEF